MASSQFPKGLRVLLVDDIHSAASTRTQLESPSLQYTVTSVHSGAEALSYLRTGVAAFDVVLAESRIVAGDEAVGRSFVDAFEDTPVVLMSAGSSPNDVMRAVKLGAVDFLDKPLSHLKLKNIWQHSVRKMMAKAAGPRAAAACVPPPAAVACAAFQAASSWATAPASPASLAPESPGTPSAMSGDLNDFMYSSCSEEGSARNSMECASAPLATRTGSAPLPAAPLSRPTSYSSLPAAPLANGAPAPAVWPTLPSGCVWGTPANGPVPPPLPAASQQQQAAAAAAAAPAAAPPPAAPWSSASTPLLHAPSCESPLILKSNSAPLLPVVPASIDEPLIPEGFLSDAAAFSKSGTGPLGLQLKKSASLLNLINSSLSCNAANDSYNGLAAMVC